MVMKYNQSEDQNVGGVYEGFPVGSAPDVLCLENAERNENVYAIRI